MLTPPVKLLCVLKVCADKLDLKTGLSLCSGAKERKTKSLIHFSFISDLNLLFAQQFKGGVNELFTEREQSTNTRFLSTSKLLDCKEIPTESNKSVL